MEKPKIEREARLEALRAEIARGRASGAGMAAEKAFARARARIDAIARGTRGDRRNMMLD